MKTAKTLSLSMAVACLAFLTPQLVRAQSADAQAMNNSSAMSPINNTAAQQMASQMVPADAHLVKSLDAKKVQPGMPFEAVVDGTVHLKDGTELPHGTVLVGDVATDQMETSGVSHLALRFTEAKLKDGKTLPIQAMIVGVAGPANGGGYDAGEGVNAPPAWNGQTFQIDEIGAMHHVDLHSRIVGQNSGVFVSTKDNVKLAAGSQLSLAIAPESNGMRNSQTGSM